MENQFIFLGAVTGLPVLPILPFSSSIIISRLEMVPQFYELTGNPQ
jgi:hypothetical protein